MVRFALLPEQWSRRQFLFGSAISTMVQWIGWALVSVFARDIAYLIEARSRRAHDQLKELAFCWWRDHAVARSLRYAARRFRGGSPASSLLASGYHRHGFESSVDEISGDVWVRNPAFEDSKWRLVASGTHPAYRRVLMRTPSQDLCDLRYDPAPATVIDLDHDPAGKPEQNENLDDGLLLKVVACCCSRILSKDK